MDATTELAMSARRTTTTRLGAGSRLWPLGRSSLPIRQTSRLRSRLTWLAFGLDWTDSVAPTPPRAYNAPDEQRGELMLRLRGSRADVDLGVGCKPADGNWIRGSSLLGASKSLPFDMMVV